MEQESMENLGFTKENSLKTEEERKKELAEKFFQVSEEARKNVEKYFKEMYKEELKNDSNFKN
jgi:hypothetical protein